MSDNFLSRYRANPEALPKLMYRVHYSPCQTRWYDDEYGGFESVLHTTPATEELFVKTMLQHLRWEHIRSPFISLFSDEEHAQNWALDRSRKIGKECNVVKIWSGPGNCAQFFHVPSLWSQLPHDSEDARRNCPTWHEHEYLCLFQIPSQARLIDRSTKEIRGE
jgi:hypothetical protein